MPRRNRVAPDGAIIAGPGRGLFLGNRGILHDRNGDLGQATYRHRAWITCALSFKDRKLPLSDPGHYTVLFFLDEAVALAAGHRPCAECRRADYNRFRAAWLDAGLTRITRAPEIDRCLHMARVAPRKRTKITHRADLASLPDGCFIATQAGPMLLWGDTMHRFSMTGYQPPVPRPVAGKATVLTPAPLVELLRAGYQPAYHPTLG